VGQVYIFSGKGSLVNSYHLIEVVDT